MDKKVKEILINLYKEHNFTYDEGKDLYSNYAAQLFNIPYEECLEWKYNKPYPLGKERRMIVKLFIVSQYCPR